MDQGEHDMFRPQPSSDSPLPPHLSAVAQVQESIDAAVVGIRQIAGHAFGEPKDELAHSGNRLVGSLDRLRETLAGFIETKATAESGFEESKLLASIEKWQRRYQELEGEYARVEARLLQLETENDGLTEECQRLRAVNEEVSLRVERSLYIIEDLLDEGDGDEKYRNHH